MYLKKIGKFSQYESVPFGYGGIFSTKQIPSTYLDFILAHLAKEIGLGGVLFINLPPFYDLKIKKNTNIARSRNKINYTHILFLEEGFNYIWKNRFSKSCRNAVMKAKRSSIKIIDENSIDNIKIFYSMYLERVKEWGYKKPPHPWLLYKNLYKYGSKNVKYRYALKDKKIVAGLIELTYNKNLFLWMSVFNKKYKSYNPVTLLHADSIHQACDEGYKIYNLGSSSARGRTLKGVKIFKEGFGAKEIKINRYIVGLKSTLLIYNFYSNFARAKKTQEM